MTVPIYEHDIYLMSLMLCGRQFTIKQFGVHRVVQKLVDGKLQSALVNPKDIDRLINELECAYVEDDGFIRLNGCGEYLVNKHWNLVVDSLLADGFIDNPDSPEQATLKYIKGL